MTTYAYARVSSQDQNISRQLDAFSLFGVKKQNIYYDKKTGKDFERENYKKLIKKLKRNDLLVIKSIDRFGRDYDSIIYEWNNITNIIGADILVLDMPLLDTRSKSNSLVGKFISDIVLQVLSFVAENERTNIKQRQKEGIISAKLQGVKFGRPQKEYSNSFMQIIIKYKNKEISMEQALSLSGYKRCNFYYHMRRAFALKKC